MQAERNSTQLAQLQVTQYQDLEKAHRPKKDKKRDDDKKASKVVKTVSRRKHKVDKRERSGKGSSPSDDAENREESKADEIGEV